MNRNTPKPIIALCLLILYYSVSYADDDQLIDEAYFDDDSLFEFGEENDFVDNTYDDWDTMGEMFSDEGQAEGEIPEWVFRPIEMMIESGLRFTLNEGLPVEVDSEADQETQIEIPAQKNGSPIVRRKGESQLLFVCRYVQKE